MTREQFLGALARRYPQAVVVEVATVLRAGWEMDNHIALVRERGELRYITTDHGRLCETSRGAVEKAIAEHERATLSCRRLLEMADKARL
ncbi:hypothetical protein [Micromonospora sp. NPDC005652]|uniref:hypothetical protein n=1 Tax=Micromonospora sp. NPDC005652 TaxID=3157046 RepID=UPI0034108FC7